MSIAPEEIFGPVVVAEPFTKSEELVASANSTPYGLAAGRGTSTRRMGSRLNSRPERSGSTTTTSSTRRCRSPATGNPAGAARWAAKPWNSTPRPKGWRSGGILAAARTGRQVHTRDPLSVRGKRTFPGTRERFVSSGNHVSCWSVVLRPRTDWQSVIGARATLRQPQHFQSTNSTPPSVFRPTNYRLLTTHHGPSMLYPRAATPNSELLRALRLRSPNYSNAAPHSPPAAIQRLLRQKQGPGQSPALCSLLCR